MRRFVFSASLIFALGAAITTAGAQWLLLALGSPITFSLALAATRNDTAGGTSVTYNSGGNPSCGAADVNRTVIAFVFVRTTNTAGGITSASIGGITATQVAGAAAVISNDTFSDIWQAAVPAGTTCAVVVNYANSSARSAIGLYRLISGTPIRTAATSNTTTAGTSVATTITVPTGGKGVTVVGVKGSSTPTGVTFTNGTNTQNSGPFASSYFANADVTGTGSVTITGTRVGSGNDNLVMSTAAWGP